MKSKLWFKGSTQYFRCFLLAFVFLCSKSTAQNVYKLPDSSVTNWRKDLLFLAENMEKKHKNLYNTISKKYFDSTVQSLYSLIPILERYEIIVGMMQIEAMIGDGHTSMNPVRDAKIGFRTLPVNFYLFSDGIFIRSAAKEYSTLVGKQVVRIENMSAEDVFKKITTVTSNDNESGVKFFAAIYMSIPEILSALGIVKNMESIKLVVKNKSGKEESIILYPYGLAEIRKGEMDLSWQIKDGWVDMREVSKEPTPLWLRAKPGEKYWLQYLSKENLLYVQINEIGNKEANEEQITDFYKRVFRTVDSLQVDKLVLDLRLNGGGNGFFNKPFLLGLIKSRIDEKGKVFCITNRRTFSAAQLLVNLLAQYTNTLFVGEPSGSKLNSYGDSYKIILPQSGITAKVSTLWHQSGHPKDTDSFIPVDIPVGLYSYEYTNNIDAALNAIFQYKSPNLK